MANTWFGRFAVFVLVLIALRVFFRWNISIIGSILLTILVYGILHVWESRSEVRKPRS